MTVNATNETNTELHQEAKLEKEQAKVARDVLDAVDSNLWSKQTWGE